MNKEIEKIDEYKCECCGGVWEFCPKDYDIDKMPYPTRCPFCSMPITQLIHDLKGDPLYLIKIIYSRVVNSLKKDENKKEIKPS